MKNKSYFKTVVIFALVLVIATSLGFALPAAPCYAQGGYAIDDDDDAGIPHPGFASLSDMTDPSGVLTDTVTIKSPDGLCQLTLDKNTKALNKERERLLGIIMVKTKEPPVPPPNANIIGLVYDLGPTGATFNPSITLTVTYDPANIPEDVAEADLVLAYYDAGTSKWVNLVCVVDPVTNTISAKIKHFTPFAVLDYLRPAAFAASNLSIIPEEVDIGEEVTISTLTTNTGNLAGSYEITLKIDNVAVATRDITLAGGNSQKVTFFTTRDVAGTYTVTIDGLSGTFVVKAAPVVPPPVTPPPVAPPPVTPPPVTPPPVVPPTLINWWLVGGILAGATVISVITWQLVVRQRARLSRKKLIKSKGK